MLKLKKVKPTAVTDAELVAMAREDAKKIDCLITQFLKFSKIDP